ncbi:MAG: cell division protein FtsB [Nevskiales bacterium]|nr:cell division protein FtsB [Nevskiales bacterium]
MARVLNILLLLFLAAFQYRLWIADGGLAHAHRLKTELQQQQEENEQRRVRNATLEAEILDLKSGVAAIESRARNALGMVKRGETFYLVIERSS